MAAFLEGLKFAENAMLEREFEDAKSADLCTKHAVNFGEGVAEFVRHNEKRRELAQQATRNERREAIIKC